MSKTVVTELTPSLEGRPGEDYDEDIFLYFLALERARAQHANRRVRLLTATVEPVPGKPAPISAATAARLFEGLRSSLRETDIMGWYRQHRVAAAVLSEHPDHPGADVSDVIQRRVREGLRLHLPSRIADSLRVRVTSVRPEPFWEQLGS